MADGFNQQDGGFFQSNYYDNQQNYGYDMGNQSQGQQQQQQQPQPQFGQEPQFQQFDYNAQGYGDPNTGSFNPDASYRNPNQAMYMGSIFTPSAPAQAQKAEYGENYDDEPPLLEELGINFDHIVQKTMTVLNPVKTADSTIMQDTDLAGPLVFLLAFAASLLLSGKVHFGYIYGIGVVGCLAMYCLLNLMSLSGVSVGVTISVLGYCILPMIFLSFMAVGLSLQGIFGLVLTSLTVLWCSMSASKLFVSALNMDSQQLLVAYPCALVYGVFALITVF